MIDYEAEGLVSPEAIRGLLGDDREWSFTAQQSRAMRKMFGPGGTLDEWFIDFDDGSRMGLYPDDVGQDASAWRRAALMSTVPALARTIERQAEELAKAEERERALRDAIGGVIDIDPTRQYGVCSECGMGSGHEPECAWATAARLIGWIR